jgi:prolyl oligopeptidase
MPGASVAAVLLVAGCSGPSKPQGLRYPDAPVGEHTDVYHGVPVADPYRALEDLDSPATRAWVDAQNKLSLPYLASLPSRDHFAARVRALIDYERYGIPEHRAGVYVYTHNTGDQEQDVIRVTEGLPARGQVLVDPDAFSDDGSVSVGSFELSPEGRFLAYSLSDGGSDWRTWRVRDVGSGVDLDDELAGIKFSGVSWSADSAGFYYSRYPGEAPQFDDQRQVSVWFHRLNTPQSEDQQVFAVTDHPTRNPYARVTDDGRYLILELWDGYITNGIYYQALEQGRPSGPVVRLLDEWDARYEFLGNDRDRFFFSTTRDAEFGRVIAIDLERSDPANWMEIVAQGSAAIEAASMVGESIFVRYVVDAHAQVQVYDLQGHEGRRIALPGKGTAAGFAGRAGDKETFFSYTDFTTPRAIFRYDLASAQIASVWQPGAAVGPESFETDQVFFESRDGTLVPMYIVRRKDIDGPAPTVLYGYGGFNISVLPWYSAGRMAWLEAGGVYAVVNLRGGGEYGEAWHRAGSVLNKQNVFDDFIAAAEWLIETGYTNSDQLAIWGRSNGGLLVGAVMNQRPDLFRAAVADVGLLDMLRYHLASANARQWSTEYGSSESQVEFEALYGYSPYHNIADGTCYPSTLVLADANDDRVLPWHSYKYAAALQKAQGCDRPALIRIDTRTGHGADAAISKIVNEYADQWAFVAREIGLESAALSE